MSVVPSSKGVLLIDFDATLYPWAPLDDDSPPLPGAIEALRSLKDAGYVIRIFSSRLSEKWLNDSGEDGTEQVRLMKWRLDRDGIPHDGFAWDKEPAEWYIDDRAISFRNNWAVIATELVWRKKHVHFSPEGEDCSCGEVADG